MEIANILGFQNRTQGHCVLVLNKDEQRASRGAVAAAGRSALARES